MLDRFFAIASRVPSWAHWTLSVFWCAFFCAIAFGLFSLNIWSISQREFFTYSAIFIFLIVAAAAIYQHLKDKKAPYIAFIIFICALIPRVLTIASFRYFPFSDNLTYFRLGLLLREGDLDAVAATSAAFHDPSSIAGLSVLNGILSSIFTPTVIGMQIANAFMTSLICVVVFFIGKEYDKRVGIVAGLLFTIYPANIFMGLTTTNEHGAVLFIMLGILLLCLALKHKHRWGIFLSASIFSFCLGHYFKSSTTLIALLALGFTATFVLILKLTTGNRVKHTLLIFSSFFLGLFALIFVCNNVMLHFGLINSTDRRPAIVTFIKGFNEDTLGMWNAEDAILVQESSPKEALDIIVSRIKNNKNLPRFFYQKAQISWLYRDCAFSWTITGYHMWHERSLGIVGTHPGDFHEHSEGFQVSYAELFRRISAISNIDVLFVTSILLLASTGAIVRQNKGSSMTLDALQWFVTGFMILFLLSEIQPRYRYAAMPALFLFASIAIVWLYDQVAHRDLIRKIRKKISNAIIEKI